MGFFSEFRNNELIRELQRELNTDVLLFGLDGFTFFGNLQGIDDCRIAILSPAIKAETSNVEILTPGGDLREVSFTRVDLWQIVAKGTGIVRDPIDPHIKGSEEITRNEESAERQESHNLIHQLCRMLGDNVAITTLGGFFFQGVLSNLEDELATLTVDNISVPGDSTSISDRDVRSVVVNLEALTSVSGINCCS